ncbi:hypothetical protein CPI83_29725 (plasmid) [Rhodococcus sp. H-CA8f]|uniref:hypothetical protein n=1 Tax=Rhodococcus sp. H-CA8f TaxID=1727214 RepID=UPI000BE445A3|nr:hypothetical protein [Rhodococcus sp. H-CA8f]ATI36381.1 hypothetical protein CPI83_29725 [Rhodococcus sp. H-CA8f]
MAEIVVDEAEATAALDRGRGQVEEVANDAKSDEPQSDDPKVADLLRALSDRTAEDSDRAADTATDGASAAQGLTNADEESAAAVGAAPTGASPASSRSSTATLSPTQMSAQPSQQSQLMAAQQQQQAMAAQQQQMMAAAAQQQQQQAMKAQQSMMQQSMMQQTMNAASAGVTAGLPAGTILVDPNDLAALIDSGDSGASGGAESGAEAGKKWNGSTSPEPIDVGQVEYNKTHGVQTTEEMSKYVDSALDKTGVEDPAARAKWKDILLYMAESESSNNADAVNNWDSNAIGATQVDGSPAQSSRGPWQTIPTTFAAHHAAGTSNNIYDPEASAGAAINYMMDRYSISPDGTGLDEFYAARRHGSYVGY